MLDYEVQRKLVIVFILGLILVVIGSLVALVFTWLPEPEKEENEFEVGKITHTSSSEEDIIQKYYKELYVMFINNDIDKIYSITGKDYLEYNNMDKEDLRIFLSDKGVFSRGLELIQYKNYIVSGYSNIYELDLKAKDEIYSINVVIREKSPEDYTITFDMFIDYKENAYKATRNSIELEIYKLIRYTNSVQYEFNLRNNYDKVVKINSEGSGNPIILIDSQGKTKRPIMTSMATAEFSIDPRGLRSYTAAFKIEDSYDYIYFNKLVIKDVEFSELVGTTNLEFSLT